MEKLYTLLQNNGFQVSFDTRTLKKGDIFFALKGETGSDGNLYAEDALARGALCAVVDDLRLSSLHNIFFVDNVLSTFQNLAHHHRKQFTIPIIALTGSNGKTTTKEMIREVLSKKYSVLATGGNLNNHIGVPLTLLHLKSHHDIGVIEMGANHVGEIARLCEIAEPTHGLITNIGKAHVGYFGSLEKVVEAKGELYDYLKMSGGVVYVDTKDPTLLQMASDRDLEGVPYVESFSVTLKLFGSYNLQNARGAFTIGRDFGISEKDCSDALEEYEPTSDRSRILKSNKGNSIIADMYNANPTSMKYALEEFANYSTEQEKVVIVGDMRELGEYAKEEHQNIITLLETLSFKEVYLVGQEFKDSNSDFKTFNTVAECIEYLKLKHYSNKCFFIKASRGIALDKILKEKIL